jgi:selenocysteine lyase/cysteine desulfurase
VSASSYKTDNYLPIFSFHLTNLHYNFIVVLLNDIFGIQTRGGIGCCGLLAEYIENKLGFRGWCRVSFHWLMNEETIKFIFKAIEFVIKKGHKFLSYYDYDSKQNLYIFKY